MKVTADGWPALVYPAQHRVPVHGDAPTVLKSRHYLPAPTVNFDHAGRHIILTHQKGFLPATTGLA